MAGGGAEKELVVVENREWVLVAYAPEGLPTSKHLELKTVNLSLAVDSIQHQEVAVQILWLSVDPYLRNRMNGEKDSAPFALNQAIMTFGVGRVIRSKDEKFTEGDIVVSSIFPVAEYSVLPSNFLRKVDPTAGIALPDYLSCLGVPGFAAWIGIEVLAKPKPGSNVFISSAAGGVGMFAGQLAKIKGCRVIGSTGSDEKVKLAKEEFGYDEVFNYKKETDLDAALSKYFPNGIDIYLDNVGGKMLEAVLNNVNKGAHIPVCGMISQYNKKWEEREGVRNLLNIVGKEVRLEGYMAGSYMNQFGDFLKEMEGYIKEGKIRSKNKIYNGIESFLESLASLFSSSNDGKVMIQVRP